MTVALLIAILAAAVQSGTPILYATLGEMFTQRSGVNNLGVEGMMMVGAFAGFMGLYISGNPWVGVLFAGVAGMLMGGLHGVVCLVFRGNQIVSGLALTIFGTGLADYMGDPYVGVSTNGFMPFELPGLSAIPVVGPILFKQDALVILSYFIAPLMWLVLQRTRLGMALRATGERPEVVRAAGLSPLFMRWLGCLWGGFLVGIGGGYLSLAYTHMWSHSMSSGRGWIAVALVIFAFWRPGRAVVGAYLFGGVVAFQMRLQATGASIPSGFLQMLPYVLTLLVLLISSARGKGRGAPANLGVNLEPGE